MWPGAIPETAKCMSHYDMQNEFTTTVDNENKHAILSAWFLANVILTFTFAICYRLSVCLSSVCNVGAPYSAG